MSLYGHSFITFSEISDLQIQSILNCADRIKNKKEKKQRVGETAALLFFEPSTRTRLSFQTALAHMGITPVTIDGKVGTSIEKGESLLDTVLNVSAMKHQLLIIRSGDDLDLSEIKKLTHTPLINAGWGKKAHPTQALLDLYTMIQKLGDVRGKKILIIGDVLHSRVASSHFELLHRWGMKMYVATPPNLRQSIDHVQFINDVDEIIGDCDVVMTLRAQLERHDTKTLWPQDFRQKFGIDKKRMGKMKKSSILMHPGPVQFGMELEREVLEDSRCVIFDQVQNGVIVREALMHEVLGL